MISWKTGCRLLAVALITSVSIPAAAQYRLFSWENFENAGNGLPAVLQHGHAGTEQTTRPFPYQSPMAPPGLLDGVARQENERVGVAFTPTEDNPHLSLTHRVFLNRNRLGDTGSALVQADFYLPPAGQPHPNFAMLAVQNPEGAETTYRFYRFGVLDEQIYFSFTNGGSQPEVYVNAPLESMELEPGWHRFQIIFYGQQEIYCAIDGEFTSFSPVREGTLDMISPGIMVTGPDTGTAIADNLSIQWTPVAGTPLPVSPWKSGVATARPGVGGNNPKLIEADSTVGWHTNTSAAWSAAQGSGKPLLVLFHIPDIPAYDYLVNLSPDDESAKEWFSNFVPLRIDINQLSGARAAEQFNVYRVPTMMVLGTDGQPKGNVVVRPDETTWNQITTQLGNAVQLGG